MKVESPDGARKFNDCGIGSVTKVIVLLAGHVPVAAVATIGVATPGL
jgi:hypothetical protein